MTCAACVARVERTLEKQPGIESATVNLATETANIDFLPEQVGPQQIQEAITKAGYEPVEVPDRSTRSARCRRLTIAASCSTSGWQQP